MAILKRHKSSVHGLTSDLNNLSQAISNEVADRAAAQGTLSTLTTTAKSSLVAAVNEVKASVAASDAGSLKIANNLSELTDVAAARTKLDVLSQAEVNQWIQQYLSGINQNYTVMDIAERDALFMLTWGSRVLVLDDGDGKWAIYCPETQDEGVTLTWTKLADQDAFNNAITAPAIKASYESNADTNAFTDAHKEKVDLLLVTQEIDLDQAILESELVNDLTNYETPDRPPTADAVVNYVDRVAPRIQLETHTVVGDEITLDYRPYGNLDGILNFATVRYVDGNGVAFDAPVIVTANDKIFKIATDSVNEWDGFDVQIQYFTTEELGV